MMKYAFNPPQMCANSYEYVSNNAGNLRALPVLSIMSPSSQ